MTGVAPSAANSWAIARPILLAPPVIIATFRLIEPCNHSFLQTHPLPLFYNFICINEWVHPDYI